MAHARGMAVSKGQTAVHIERGKRIVREQQEVAEIDEEELRAKQRVRRNQLRKRLAYLRSTFKKEVGEIQENLDNNEADRGITKFQKSMLQTLLELIVIAEDQYRRSEGAERAAYALNTLISQSRELIADIDSAKDYDALVNELTEKVIWPEFLHTAQVLVNEIWVLNKSLTPYIEQGYEKRVGDLMDEQAKVFARKLQETYTTIVDKVRNLILDEG